MIYIHPEKRLCWTQQVRHGVVSLFQLHADIELIGVPESLVAVDAITRQDHRFDLVRKSGSQGAVRSDELRYMQSHIPSEGVYTADEATLPVEISAITCGISSLLCQDSKRPRIPSGFRIPEASLTEVRSDCFAVLQTFSVWALGAFHVIPFCDFHPG